MVALNLKSPKLDVKLGYEGFKRIRTLLHQLQGYFLPENLGLVARRVFKVFEQQNKHVPRVTGNLHKEDGLRNFMKVSVQHGPLLLNAQFVVADVHGRRSFLRNDVYGRELRL